MSPYQPSIPPPPAPYPPELWLALAVTVVCLTVGAALLLWVGRRHFYRRNEAGIEEFKNYRSAVLSGIVEGGATLFAGACLVVGAIAGLLSCATLFANR